MFRTDFLSPRASQGPLVLRCQEGMYRSLSEQDRAFWRLACMMSQGCGQTALEVERPLPGGAQGDCRPLCEAHGQTRSLPQMLTPPGAPSPNHRLPARA